MSTVLVMALAMLAAIPGPSFNSGSTGAYGPMNVTNNATLDLPPDGIFHCTTINLAAGKTLKFQPNPLNTPVYLLATGDITIEGTIDVSGNDAVGGAPGRGGPGGFDGGFGGFSGLNGGDGLGPGGGTPGNYDYGLAVAAFGHAVSRNTNQYGNALLSPLIGGSGGAGTPGNPGRGGGGGGGAVLLSANTRVVVDGAVTSSGGSSSGIGAGSGGAIRIVSPVVSGKGQLSVGGGGTGDYRYNAGSGRIRVDCQDSLSFRSLAVYGVVTRGSQMFVFPPVVPRLDIIEAAGSAIPEGTASGVKIDLPPSSSTNQTVKVQARNFTGTVPIRVVVTPEYGPSRIFSATIDMAGGSVAQVTVPVVILQGTVSRIYVWTR